MSSLNFGEARPLPGPLPGPLIPMLQPCILHAPSSCAFFGRLTWALCVDSIFFHFCCGSNRNRNQPAGTVILTKPVLILTKIYLYTERKGRWGGAIPSGRLPARIPLCNVQGAIRTTSKQTHTNNMETNRRHSDQVGTNLADCPFDDQDLTLQGCPIISTAHMVRSVSLCLYSFKMLTLKKTQELGCVNAKWLRNCACSEVKPFI